MAWKREKNNISVSFCTGSFGFYDVIAKSINSWTLYWHNFSVAPVKSLEGPLKLNTLLDNAERLFEGKLLAPENILEKDGVLYVSVKNNQVVKIVNDKSEVIADFGKGSCCKW